MKLLFDVGNTRTKWVLMDYSGEVVVRGFLDESGEFDSSAFLPNMQDTVTEVWVSCVAKTQVLDRLSRMIKRLLGLDVSLASVEPALGLLNNGYKDLDSLGVDRWVAALGAREVITTGDLIVIDAGTAVTIDYVSEVNVFEGGVIIPGLKMMHDSLVGKTAGIFSEFHSTEALIGKTTQECVNAGVTFGLVGAIEKVVEEMQSRCASNNVNVLICGGDAGRIQSLSKRPLQLNSDLIFQGLNLISNIKQK